MRYPEAKLKEAILHPDRDIRDAVMRYFYDSTVPDCALMPLSIEALERYGRTNAFTYTHTLNLLPQTEQTIAWVLAELQGDFEGPPEEQYYYFLNLSRLLCHADIRLVAPRAEEIHQAPHFDAKERLAFRERLEMVGWNAEKCWQALHQYCETNKDKRNFEEFDLGHALRIVGALARQPHEYQGEILALLAQKTRDYRGDARKWLQPLLANLAGGMRLSAAIPLLVGNLGHPYSFLSDQSMFALARIGTEEVVTLVCDRFPQASSDFRHYASELLGKIHLDLTVLRVLELLPGETELVVRMSLCEALLAHHSFEGVEPARQLIKQHELIPDLRHLRSSLITHCKLSGVRFPEFDEFEAHAREDDQNLRRTMDEMQKLAYEARGDLGLLVQKLKANLAKERTASPGPTPHSRLAQRPDAGQQDRVRLPDRTRVGRNTPCPCGSGKKFKHCCLK